MMISVYAGEDTTVCDDAIINLNAFGAYVTGEVSDGTWFTDGDGYFDNGGTSMTFSQASRYTPGIGDLFSGQFVLTLVSDDPDGNGPKVEVFDQVIVTFQQPPPLVCNQSLNISLGEQCEQEILIQMLMSNPAPPLNRYLIYAYDQAGDLITGNILTASHIGHTVSFEVFHECGGNSCHGTLSVSDKSAPRIICREKTIDCTEGIIAVEVGLPRFMYSDIDTITADSFYIRGLDGCSDTWLTHTDMATIYSCTSANVQAIERSWRAVDMYANIGQCNQRITVARAGLDSVTLTRNYNDLDLPSISCADTFPKLANGAPSPSFTGYPNVYGCTNMEATYQDAIYQSCGASYSVWRSWLIIDWCTSEDLQYNQIIKINDTLAPVFTCPPSITVGTDAYDCVSLPFEIMTGNDIYDCSLTTANASLTHVTTGALYQSASLEFDQIPVGTYNVNFIVTDACGNASSCVSQVQIIDDATPFPICEGQTSVTIGITGVGRMQAITLDDHSIDNCGIQSYEVAKMTDQCNTSSAGIFNTYVDFCCEEVGTTIQVALRVTDMAGNSNTCMTTVRVDDKTAPQITAPTNVTINCDFPYDFDDLEAFGRVVAEVSSRSTFTLPGTNVSITHGLVTDNCSAMVKDTFDQDIECGIGTITRRFIAIDAGNRRDTAYQTITIRNAEPFTEDDITWPEDQSLIACTGADLDPDQTGRPIFNNAACANLVASYEDREYLVQDTACVKILRTWTVADWCQYDQVTDFGLWEHVQIINLDNTVAPVIQCRDTVICSYTQDCGPTAFSYQIAASDDCSDAASMDYYWVVRRLGQMTIEASGFTRSVSLTLIPDTYIIDITVEDGCGNSAACTDTITVADCKKPVVYCESSITTVIMPSTGSLEIFAKTFDYDSYDNCSESLRFSFSSDVLDSTKILTCDDLDQLPSKTLSLDVWVTDEVGNQDYCTVTLILQDPSRTCSTGGLNVGGRITSADGTTINGVHLQLKSVTHPYVYDTIVDEGAYLFDRVVPGLSYTLTPQKLDEIKKGVSTKDLVWIQRHIINAQRFTTPDQMLAADINADSRISGQDVVMLRKLILGKISDLPQEPFRFYPVAHIFEDTLAPYGVNQEIRIENLDEDRLREDFRVVKIGDVDGNAFSVNRSQSTESRSSVPMYYEKSSENMVTFELDRKVEVGDGLQFSLSFGREIVSVQGLPESDFHIVNDQLLVSVLGQQDNGKVVFDVELSTAGKVYQPIMSPALEPEIYSQEGDQTLYLADRQTEVAVYRNPCSHIFIIEQDHVIEYDITIHTIEGKLLYKNRHSGTAKVDVASFDYVGMAMVSTYNSKGSVNTYKLLLQ